MQDSRFTKTEAGYIIKFFSVTIEVLEDDLEVLQNLLEEMNREFRSTCEETSLGDFLDLSQAVDEYDEASCLRAEKVLFEHIKQLNRTMDAALEQLLLHGLYAIKYKQDDFYYAPFMQSKLFVYGFLVAMFPHANELTGYWKALGKSSVQFFRELCYFMAVHFDFTMKYAISEPEIEELKGVVDAVLFITQEMENAMPNYDDLSLSMDSNSSMGSNLSGLRIKTKLQTLQQYVSGHSGRSQVDAAIDRALAEHDDDDDDDEEDEADDGNDMMSVNSYGSHASEKRLKMNSGDYERIMYKLAHEADPRAQELVRKRKAVAKKHQEVMQAKTDAIAAMHDFVANKVDPDNADDVFMSQVANITLPVNTYHLVLCDIIPLLVSRYPPQIQRADTGVNPTHLQSVVLLLPYLLHDRCDFFFRVVDKYAPVAAVYPYADPTTLLGLYIYVQFFTETHLMLVIKEAIAHRMREKARSCCGLLASIDKLKI